MRLRIASVGLFCLLFSLCSIAQQTTQFAAPNEHITVPHLIRISGQMPSASGTIGVTFALYKSQTDTAPLWTETQNIRLDVNGKYSVLVGATKAEGIPLELFASGEAQWLGIRKEGQAEQPRVLLVSVPYAMKAGEAETLSGHAASEFVTQQNLGEMVQLKLQEPEIRTVLANPFVAATTPATAGATNFVDSTSNQIIAITQNGTGRLITGSGPSHTQVFAVDQNGQIHGSGLSLDGSAGRTIGMGNNSTSGGSGYQLTVRAGEAAVGSANQRGGELILAAGPGSGTGGSGNVVIETAAPQYLASVDALTPRHVYASSPVSMGGAAGDIVPAALNLGPGASGSIGIRFKIHATDGNQNFGVAAGECIVTGEFNHDASVGYGTVKFSGDYTEAVSFSGSIGTTCQTATTSGSTWGVEIKDNLPFTPTAHYITYEIYNVSEWPLHLYFNTSGTEKMPLVAASTVPGASREHPVVSVRKEIHGDIVTMREEKP